MAARILAAYVEGQSDLLVYKEEGQVKAIMITKHTQLPDDAVQRVYTRYTEPDGLNNYLQDLRNFFSQSATVKQLDYERTRHNNGPGIVLQGLFYSEDKRSLFNTHELFYKEFSFLYPHQQLHIHAWCAMADRPHFEPVFNNFAPSVRIPPPVLLNAPSQPLGHDVTIELCGNRSVLLPAGWTSSWMTLLLNSARSMGRMVFI